MNTLINKKTQFIDLGLIDYKQAWDYQIRLFDEILNVKSANRTASEQDQQQTNNYLIFCEHPHVFTLGKSGNEKNLLLTSDQLKEVNASYYPINRGGDITYHGPGQLVVYPVIDLENFFTDIHLYMRHLEESVIRTLQQYEIQADRIPGLTGVWMDKENDPRKICALGVKTSRWVTQHGLAFNVNADLSYFNYIVPCGIDDKGVTSLQKELGRTLDMTIVKNQMKQHLITLFGMELF